MAKHRNLLPRTAAPWLLLWLGALVAAIGLTTLVMSDRVPGEVSVILEVQGWDVPGETVSSLVRAVTSTEVVLAAGVLVVVLHWASGDRVAAVVLVVLLVLLPVTQAGVKELVDRKRPPEVDARIEARAGFTSPSFPAGHVMSPSVVYGWAVLSLLRRSPAGPAEAGRCSRSALANPAVRPVERRLRVLARSLLALGLVALPGLSGIVSVQLGVHWPSDVLGGYAWGAVLLIPAFAIYGRRSQAR